MVWVDGRVCGHCRSEDTYAVKSGKPMPHAQRYVDEFCWRHNIRDLDTIRQMQDLVARMVGRRITYRQLTARPVGLAAEPF